MFSTLFYYILLPAAACAGGLLVMRSKILNVNGTHSTYVDATSAVTTTTGDKSVKGQVDWYSNLFQKKDATKSHSDGLEERRRNYADMIDGFYNLVTQFYR
jgi:hypothetical protein